MSKARTVADFGNGITDADLPSNSVRGIAKAWVSFNGTGTVAVRDSLNVSSVSDNGTGNYSVYYSSNFDTSGNYTVAGNGAYIGALWFTPANLSNMAANATLMYALNSAAASADLESAVASMHGDLA